MEISAYLCSRNPLHAAGGARPMHGSLLTRPLQPAKPKGGAALASYTNGDGARPKLGQAPAPTELAAPKNSPARRGSTTQKLNVIKTHTNMTTLDLNAYGVTEMSHAEKVENNGGYWQIIAAIVSAALYCYDNWDDMGPATENGYAAGDSIYKP